MNFFKKLGSNVVSLTSLPNSPQQNELQINTTSVGRSSETIEEKVGKQAVYADWMFSAYLGQPRRIDVKLLRSYAKSGWVQMVIGTFSRQISALDWRIVPEDPTDKTDRTKDIELVTNFFKKMNENPQSSVNDLDCEVIDDIATLDSGVFNYVYSKDSYEEGVIEILDNIGGVLTSYNGLKLKPLGKRKLIAVKSVDGGSMLKDVDLYKNLRGYYQYSFKHPLLNPTKYEKEEISFIVMRKKASSVYGFSPVEGIVQELEVLIQGTKRNKDIFKNFAIPDVLIALEKANPDALRKLKSEWLSANANKSNPVHFINYPISGVQKLAESNKDLEWLDGQKWYFRIVFANFGVSPDEAGFFENSNKSNDEGQERVTMRNAMRPYLAALEREHTNRTITELLQNENHGLKFEYLLKDDVREKEEFQQDMQMIQIGAMTINELRAKMGKEPLDWGDERVQQANPFQQNSNNQNLDNKKDEDKQEQKEPKDSKEDKNKFYSNCLPVKDFRVFFPEQKENIEIVHIEERELNKKYEFEELEENSKNYYDYLNNFFNKLEKQVLLDIENLDFKKIKKTNQVGKDLFDYISSEGFKRAIKRFLKADINSGRLIAEHETSVKILFNEQYVDLLNKLVDQQINGYLINGQKWHGIKGVTQELQSDVYKLVQEANSKNQSIKELREEIQNRFNIFSEYRANSIALTETNRVINESQIIGYKSSGIKGKKIFLAAPYEKGRSSEICQRLHKKYNKNGIDLDDEFIDDKTMLSFSSPPCHPHCRSRVAFSPE